MLSDVTLVLLHLNNRAQINSLSVAVEEKGCDRRRATNTYPRDITKPAISNENYSSLTLNYWEIVYFNKFYRFGGSFVNFRRNVAEISLIDT
jgi:hypothetical protein